ncbi:MAG TPA: MMPL family transporter [Gaiellaceae bacterium]|nr:MMPL family transporter [Gaiellaceae bacterium]
MNVNLAARAARWSAAHWKTAVSAWLAFCVAAIALGSVAGTRMLKQADTAAGGTKKAEQILKRAGFPSQAAESVLVGSKTGTLADPGFRAAVADVVRTVSGLPQVQKVRSPLLPANSGQVSADRRSALVQFEIRGEQEKADKQVQPVLDAVERVQQRHGGFTVAEFGFASATHELNDTLNADFTRAEYSSLPVTLVILLVAFGALVAAGLPVLLAFSGVLATIGLSSLASHVVAAGDATQSVILLIGMAVGVDYSLFYLRREREERRRGLGPREALLKAAGTSGHAVFVSGLTVLIAMAGMLFTGNAVFTSIAVGAMLMVAVALIGSLSILPALLAKLGHKVDRGRIPLIGSRSGGGESRLWSFVLDRVLRRPLLAAVLSGGALVALALPTLTLHTQLPSFTDLPKSLAIVRTYESIQRAFPGAQTPARVVVEADDVTAPRVQEAIGELKRRALASGQMFEPVSTEVNPDRTVETVSIALQGDGDNATSVAALQTLRDRVIPATLGTVPGVEAAVTGQTAGTHDFNEQMKSHAPLVFAFVLSLCFLLLLVTFRSLVIPIKAVLLNLLSVAAAYGLLVLVFQHRWAEGILGFHSNGAITSWLPLFMFVILFGLSMDYHVFILSRVKELHDAGMPTEQAVAVGIKRTAGTVTSAAVVMVAVFAIFVSLRTLDIKQMGFGLAAAILIDSTIVRAVLLPAVMKLLGDWNWYLPRWLDWLPRFEREPERRSGSRARDHARDRAPALESE